MAIPLFVLVKAEHQATINAVLVHLTSGWQSVTAPYALASAPTVISHYVMLDMGATQAVVDEFAAMPQGILPAIDGEWGADGVPSGAAAVAAMGSGNMQVVPGYGVIDPAQFTAGLFEGFEIVQWDSGI